MSKSPSKRNGKSKSPQKNGSSKKQMSNGKSHKNGSSKKDSSNKSNGSSSKSSSGSGSGSGGVIYQCRKIQLGITHEMGILEFHAGKMVWRGTNDASLKHTIVGKEIKSIEWLNVDKRKKMMKIAFVDRNRPHFRIIGFAGEVKYHNKHKVQAQNKL